MIANKHCDYVQEENIQKNVTRCLTFKKTTIIYLKFYLRNKINLIFYYSVT